MLTFTHGIDYLARDPIALSISLPLREEPSSIALPDTIQMEHWASIVPSSKAATRMLVTEMASMADAIGPQADALIQDMSEDGTHHPISKTVRTVIDTRSALVGRARDKTPL